MRRIISVLLGLGILTSLVACSKKSSNNSLEHEVNSAISSSAKSDLSSGNSISEDEEISDDDEANFHLGKLGNEQITLKKGNSFEGFTLDDLIVWDRVDFLESTYNDGRFYQKDIQAFFSVDMNLKGTFTIIPDGPNTFGVGGYITISDEELEKFLFPIQFQKYEEWVNSNNRPEYEKKYFALENTNSFSNSIEEIESITGLSEADNVPCEVTISGYVTMFIQGSDAQTLILHLKSFRPL